MAWIESHQEIGRHPKTRKLARQLDVSVPTAVGHLHLLWHWCLDFAEDGILSDFEYDEIADGALWEGDADAFVRALITCGWLDDGIHISVHDWNTYTGRIQAAREANRERQKRYRERQKPSPDGDLNESNADVTVTTTLRNGATVPNRTVPNRTVQKPEEDSVSHETAQRRASGKVTDSEPFLVWSAGCEIAGVSIQDAAGSKDRQCGKIKQLLRHHCRDDLLACFAWLHDDRLEVERGIDWFRVEARIAGWLNKGKPPPRRQQQAERGILVEMGGVRGYIDR